MKKISRCVFVSCCVVVLMGNSECMKKTPVDSQETKPSFALVTIDEIQKAINKWAYLVPGEDSTTTQVNTAIIDVAMHIESKEHNNQKMEILVRLICSPSTRKEYAHYVNNVFSSIDFSVLLSDIPVKYRRMLASIDSDRSGGGGTCADFYLQDYYSGFYDPCIPNDEDVLKWEHFPLFSQEIASDTIDI